MKNVNYYLQFKEILKNADKSKRLLLHCCCAPCSSTSLEAVEGSFDIDAFFYNPNITDEAEYQKRLSEQKRFLLDAHSGVNLIEGDYQKQTFYDLAKGLENAPERGERCLKCYRERLLKTALKAKELNYDFFATTLTLSPLKSATVLNEIGFEISKEVGVDYLPTDFKKNNGYIRSIELSKIYGLYRQNYCGCEFSKRSEQAEE